MELEKVTLINQRHDVKGQVAEFKDEFMRVRVSHEHRIEAAEYILLLYKGKQIEAKVIVVSPEEVGLFIPRLPANYFEDRRNFPRVRVDMPGVIIQEQRANLGIERRILPIQLHDVSHRGFSFTTVDEHAVVELDRTSILIVQSEQLPIGCEVVVNNDTEQFGRMRYGASISFMNHATVKTLYGFMFAKQV